MCRVGVFATAFFFLLLFCILTSSAFAVGRDQAWAAIERADYAMASAYRAVLEAEEAGADVSGLLNDLNSSAEVLAKANIRFRTGDFDGAVYLANLCYESVEGVPTEAYGLKYLAVYDRKDQLTLTSLVSIVGVSYVVFGGFLGWNMFKGRYRHRVSKMKPEVVRHES